MEDSEQKSKSSRNHRRDRSPGFGQISTVQGWYRPCLTRQRAPESVFSFRFLGASARLPSTAEGSCIRHSLHVHLGRPPECFALPPCSQPSPAAGRFPGAVGPAHPPHGTAGCGDRGGRERSADSIRVARRHHHRANASATVSPCRFSGGGNGRRDDGGLGIGNGHPVVGAGGGTVSVCLRVHALADRCRPCRKPDAESRLPQQADRGNPALAIDRHDSDPA